MTNEKDLEKFLNWKNKTDIVLKEPCKKLKCLLMESGIKKITFDYHKRKIILD